METINQYLQFELISIGEHKIKIYTLLLVFIIFITARITLWLIKKTLFQNTLTKFDITNIYAIFQIIKYIVWIIAIVLILEIIGIQVTLLLAGSAALLVGLGLGLQQTFNDIISGIILLSEGTIKIDDVLEIDGDIVIIKEIGLRTSQGLNRDDISVIIPNSLITTSKVINWSHQSKKTRFRIGVGVAYGSDVDLVLRILKESALAHDDVIDAKLVDVHFTNFGDSSLDFEVLFYTENIFRIAKIKSDIRKMINHKFIEHQISIPFPQMDVYLSRKL